MAEYDLLLTGARVVDPASGVHGIRDVGIANGKIEAIEPSLPTERAKTAIPLDGLTIVPGIIDTHVHVGGMGDGIPRAMGLRMVAQSGVTTALDLACQPQSLVKSLQSTPVGLTVAGLCHLNQRVNLSGPNPDKAEVRKVLKQALEDGAIGAKVLSSLGPEGSSNAIEVANEERAYIAFHLGTTETGSHLEGVRELPKLLGSNKVHVAHVNSYCRGVIQDAIDEALETFSILEGLDGQVVCESYMAVGNGSGAHLDGDVVAGASARNMLGLRKYPGTRQGMHQAFRDGYCSVVAPAGGVNILVTGEEAIKAWEEAGTNISISFAVNPPPVTFLCATRRKKNGSFLIDALATDGGSFPRNVLVEKGLALVKYGALSIDDFAKKGAWNPARMLGLKGKGHLAPGADADITVLNTNECKATMSFSGGELIMIDGVIVGKRNTLVVTSAGEAAATSAGLGVKVIDVSQSGLYRGLESVSLN
jgi:hypothetical protein